MTKVATNLADKARLRKRNWWRKNAKRIKKEVRTKPQSRYNALKARAKREGRDFKLSFKNYLDKLERGCYYCGTSLMEETGGSIDRRNNRNRNYSGPGLVGCCSDCNKIKSDRLTANEMVVAMKAVNKYRRRKNK